jgi:hypothetical protein
MVHTFLHHESKLSKELKQRPLDQDMTISSLGWLSGYGATKEEKK